MDTPLASHDRFSPEPLQTDGLNPEHMRKKAQRLTVWSLVGITFTTIGLAVGHHYGLSAMNGQPTQGKTWLLLGSRALTVTLVYIMGSVISRCQAQQVHRTLKLVPMTLLSIDKLVALIDNPIGLATYELWSSAPGPVILALAYWALPILHLTVPLTIAPSSGSSQLPAWRYNPAILVPAYAVAFSLELVALIVGIAIIQANRGVGNNGWLNTLVDTTYRGSALVRALKGWDAQDPMPETVGKIKVRYGLLLDRRRRRWVYRPGIGAMNDRMLLL